MRLRWTGLLLIVVALLAAGRLALATVPPGTPATDFSETKYAVVTETFADRTQVKAGDSFTLALRLTPYKTAEYEFHLYGTEPSQNQDYLKPVFKMADSPGVKWSVEFPKGEKHDGGKKPDGSYKGDIYMLHGQQVVLVHGQVAPTAKPGKRNFTAQFMFNTCTDEFCLQPSVLDLKWPLEIVPASFSGTIDVTPKDKLLAKVDVSPDKWSLPPADDASADQGATSDSSAADTAAATTKVKPGFNDSDGDKANKLPLSRALFLAFVGGLILNFMPCVLPVVSIKVISLARHAQHKPAVVVRQGLIFCLGIIVTFLALAAVVNAIQATGTQLGWGFQFQNPTFLIVMCTIIFAFALSLAGVYTIKAPSVLTEEAEQLSEKEGYAGAFFKGVLATVLGTPCVGPFLGPALGYAFTQSAGAVWGIFGAVGVGMALPYALLVSNPKFLRMGQRERGQLTRSIMDAKGWLVDFERVMAFVLFATVVYLLNILGGGLGPQAVIWALVFLLAVAFALWLWGRLVSARKLHATILGAVFAPGIIVGAGLLALPRMTPVAANETSNVLAWEKFDRDQMLTDLNNGKTVLVDFTADWCPNCKTNEAVALNIPETKNLIESLHVVTMQADWTKPDKNISMMLRSLGYSSIPLTAIFPAGAPDKPILLDGIYSAARLRDELNRATGHATGDQVAQQ